MILKWLLRKCLKLKNLEGFLLIFLVYLLYSWYSSKQLTQIQSSKLILPLVQMDPEIKLEIVDYDDIIPSNFTSRYFTAFGFKYCDFLSNSTFDGFTKLRPLGASILELNPDQSVFINLLDKRAYQIYNSLISRHPTLDPMEVKRFACYSAAEGNNAAAHLSHQRLISQIHPVTYFSPVLPAILPNPQKTRDYFKIAYLLMIHEMNGFPHACHLLELLDDGDAIILIHVDARTSSNKLYNQMNDWIKQRQAKLTRKVNIHLAKHRTKNIWGHISLVFTQLSGFWELLDLADWDYVINLSNYDYPIKSNKVIHQTLSKPEIKNKNWIEYWPAIDDLTERFYRPHLGLYDFSTIASPDDVGVINSPFSNWKIQKHHQWMIATPEFVKYLRTNHDALLFLAYCEHTYIPDEAYFASVLLNSPLKHTLVNDNKRYLRFSSNSAHPAWLGYQDRYLFPPYEDEPSIFFIRKLNVRGNLFEESKLVSWIERHHWKSPILKKCELEYASARIACLKEYANKIAINNQLVVIPANTAFANVAENLICSLKQLGITNVLIWALDQSIHEKNLQKNRLSILLPGFPGNSDNLQESSDSFIKMVRKKPLLIRYLMKAGYDVWCMDADIVALGDFRTLIGDSSIYFALDNFEQPTDVRDLQPSTSLMFFKNNNESRAYIDLWVEKLEISSTFTDQKAFRMALFDTRVEQLLPFIPLKTQIEKKESPTDQKDDQDTSAKLKDSKKDDKKIDKMENINLEQKDKNIEKRSFKIKCQAFDPYLILNAKSLKSHEMTKLPMTLHTHVDPDSYVEDTLQNLKLWFLQDGKCAWHEPKAFKARIKSH